MAGADCSSFCAHGQLGIPHSFKKNESKIVQDVGQGAEDDGGGMAAVWQAMKSIQNLGESNAVFAPKRFGNVEHF